MTRDAAMPPTRETFAAVVARLAAAQKQRAPGSPAYSIYVNRPLGRRLAAAAYLAGLTPNVVTAISAAFTFSAILLIALVLPAPLTGVGIGLLLIVGYALDSADGQLARLRGGGSPAGEWLDHVVDAAKTSSLHLAVLVAWFRFLELPSELLLLVPLGFAIVAAVLFFAMILNDFLRCARARGESARPSRGWRHPLAAGAPDRLRRALHRLPALRRARRVRTRLRAPVPREHRVHQVLALPKWFREMGRISFVNGPPHLETYRLPALNRRPAASEPLPPVRVRPLVGARVLVAHPGAELYGSDRVVLESVAAMGGRGCSRRGHRAADRTAHRTTRAAPAPRSPVGTGPRAPQERAPSSQLALDRRDDVPGDGGIATTPSADRPDLVYVNTITLPLWPIQARMRGVPVLTPHPRGRGRCARLMLEALYAPHSCRPRPSPTAFSADRSSRRPPPRSPGGPGWSTTASRARVRHPGTRLPRRRAGAPRVPRTPVAAEGHRSRDRAAAELVDDGVDAEATSSARPSPGTSGQSTTSMRRSPPTAWTPGSGSSDSGTRSGPTSGLADIVVIPSTAGEPFGNTAVEAALAARPLIVSGRAA